MGLWADSSPGQLSVRHKPVNPAHIAGLAIFRIPLAFTTLSVVLINGHRVLPYLDNTVLWK